MKASSVSPKSRRSTRTAADRPRPRDPLTNLNFVVGIEGTRSGGALEVVLPSARIVELPRKRRQVLFDPLIIRRGLTESTDWYDWWNDARRRAQPQKRRVLVTVKTTGGGIGAEWVFSDCVPVAYSVSTLHALLGAPLLESLELKVGGFDQIRRQ